MSLSPAVSVVWYQRRLQAGGRFDIGDNPTAPLTWVLRESGTAGVGLAAEYFLDLVADGVRVNGSEGDGAGQCAALGGDEALRAQDREHLPPLRDRIGGGPEA